MFPNFVSFVDKQVATYLGAGKLSALSYGQSIPNALSSMMTYSLGIAVFSYFSEWVVKKQINKLIDAVRRAINFLVMLIIPFCYYIFLSSRDIIGFLFERGEFTTGETSLVSPILQYYIFLIFFQAAVIIAARVISAIHKNKFFVVLYPSIFIIKLLFTAILIQYFDILGLPLSTLSMYIVYFVWIYWYLHHQKIQIFNTRYSFALIKNILHLFILFIILHKVYNFIDSLNLSYFYSLLYGAVLFIIIYSSLLAILYKSGAIQKSSI
jgi:putative peptidoglycan lipid II flippase